MWRSWFAGAIAGIMSPAVAAPDSEALALKRMLTLGEVTRIEAPPDFPRMELRLPYARTTLPRDPAWDAFRSPGIAAILTTNAMLLAHGTRITVRSAFRATLTTSSTRRPCLVLTAGDYILRLTEGDGSVLFKKVDLFSVSAARRGHPDGVVLTAHPVRADMDSQR
jgi:hypothetical protein